MNGKLILTPKYGDKNMLKNIGGSLKKTVRI